MVRVVRLERTVSWSQTRRDTNFAIPGYSISAIIPRQGGKSKIFLSVVIYVVKAAFVPLSAAGAKPANARVARLRSVSPCPIPDTATALPKPGAIPTSLHPDKDTPPASGRRIYYTSFFSRLQGENLSWCLLYSGGLFSLPDYSPSAAFSSSTRSVFSQATPRSSRPICP